MLFVAELSHSELTEWMSNFNWMKLGREICQCGQFRDEQFCDSFMIHHKIQCLEPKSGYRMVVKQFDTNEVQTMYNPTPSRGLTFIRVFKDQARQEWRRKRNGEITIKHLDRTFRFWENETTNVCDKHDNCRATNASVAIYDGQFPWLQL